MMWNVGHRRIQGPHVRQAWAARAARAPPSSRGKDCGVDDEPLSTVSARHGTHSTHPIPVHIGAYISSPISIHK